MSRSQLSGRDPATGQGILLSIENGKIALVESLDAVDQPWISAGLVDLQVNGYRGFDANGADVCAGTISQLARALLATGVTTFAPTVCTSFWPRHAAPARFNCPGMRSRSRCGRMHPFHPC